MRLPPGFGARPSAARPEPYVRQHSMPNHRPTGTGFYCPQSGERAPSHHRARFAEKPGQGILGSADLRFDP